MALANVLLDHCYYKQSKSKHKEELFGTRKRHVTSRKVLEGGDKLTTLKKKRNDMKRSEHGSEASAESNKKGNENNKNEIKPLIVELPRGEIFTRAMGQRCSDQLIHEWAAYKQTAAVVTVANEPHKLSSDDDSQISSDHISDASDVQDNGMELSNVTLSPSMEMKFVDMNDIDQQFANPDGSAIYSIIVPEWNSSQFIAVIETFTLQSKAPVQATSI